MYYTDDVHGIVIGEYTYTGYLYYDGRMQSQAITGNTEDEMIALCREKIQRLKDMYSDYPTYLYRDDSLWSIRTL